MKLLVSYGQKKDNMLEITVIEARPINNIHISLKANIRKRVLIKINI
jgi:hypothetical protein